MSARAAEHPLRAAGFRGELTSAALSPRWGPIALGFVRREHAQPGTRVEVDGVEGRVVELPFAEAPR